MGVPLFNDWGTALAHSLQELGHGPLRLTDHHWRLRCEDQVIDVEIDTEQGMLCMTSGRICHVPPNLKALVSELCKEHNRERGDSMVLLEEGDLYCRVQQVITEDWPLDAYLIGQQLSILSRSRRAFVDRLLGRCLDDLLIRIHPPMENDHAIAERPAR